MVVLFTVRVAAEDRLWKRRLALDQVNQVAVAVIEEEEPVAGGLERFGDNHDAFFAEVSHTRVEVFTGDREMPEPGVLIVRQHLGRGKRTRSRNDFDQSALRMLHEKIPLIREVDVETQMLHIPLRELFRIGRCNRQMFDSLEHKR